MLQYSIYSVISPEGCASILWKTSDKAQDAADALGITAHRLKALGVIDKIVNEPVGGAHRDTKQTGRHSSSVPWPMPFARSVT
jgi:acetyl-CoA carboxylase carboxyl transferase subunit alpha